MSLEMHLGERRPALKPEAKAAAVIHLDSPVLNETELAALSQQGLPVRMLSTQVAVEACAGGLGTALNDLCNNAEQLVRDGAQVLVLSDRVRADGQPFRAQRHNGGDARPLGGWSGASSPAAPKAAVAMFLGCRDGAMLEHASHGLSHRLWGECCLSMADVGNDPPLVGASQNPKAD